MQKILFYYAGLTNSNLPLGGSSRAVLNNAIALKAIAPQSDVVIVSEKITDCEEIKGVELIPLPGQEFRQDFLNNFDVVFISQHIQGFEPCYRKNSQKWILDLHCWDLDHPELRRINDFCAIIARSEIHKEHLVQKGIQAKFIHSISNIVDSDHFFERDCIRNPYSVMFAGAIVAHKGVHILLQAFSLLKPLYPQLVLNLYGSAKIWHTDSNYELNLQRLGLKDVFFRGAKSYSEMPELYSANSILCLPSDMESFGLVTVEAQACGCIPVVHKVGGTAATMLDGMTGFLYSPNTPENLSKMIEKALVHGNLMREKAVEFVQHNFNSKHIARDLLGLIS